MELFNNEVIGENNLLHKDGIVNYYGRLMSRVQAHTYFSSLFNSIEWKNDVAIIFGKRIVTKRKVVWYAEKLYEYTYSNTTKLALPWTVELLELKEIVE